MPDDLSPEQSLLIVCTARVKHYGHGTTFGAAVLLVFVFSAQFPLETIDDALDAGLKDVGSYPHGTPLVGAIRKNSQNSNQRTGAFVVLFPC